MAARTGTGGPRGAGRAAEHGGPGRRPGDRAAQRRRLPRPRPRGVERVRRRASRSDSWRSARSRSNACATAWRRASASARAGRGRSTTRASRGSARCACSWPTRATLDDPEAISETVDDVLEGLGHGDRRPAPPDHRAPARGARRPRPGGRAGGARQARPGDRRARRADRDRPRAPRRTPTRRRRRRGAWTPSSRAPIYRIVQEALTNVSRHARGHAARWCSIAERDGVVRASVTDDGKGLPGRRAARARAATASRAASGCRACASAPSSCGGELEFAPGAGQGTIVRLTVPLAGRPRGRPAPAPRAAAALRPVSGATRPGPGAARRR